MHQRLVSVQHRRVFTAKNMRCDSPHLSASRSFNLIFRSAISLKVAWLLHLAFINAALFERRVHLIMSVFKVSYLQGLLLTASHSGDRTWAQQQQHLVSAGMIAA